MVFIFLKATPFVAIESIVISTEELMDGKSI